MSATGSPFRRAVGPPYGATHKKFYSGFLLPSRSDLIAHYKGATATLDDDNSYLLPKSGTKTTPQVLGTSVQGDGSGYGTITGLLTTHTFTVGTGSDSPTCTTDGRLDIASGDNVWDLKIWDGTTLIADLPMICKGSTTEWSATSGLPDCEWTGGVTYVEHTDGVMGSDVANVKGYSEGENLAPNSSPYSGSWNINASELTDTGDGWLVPIEDGVIFPVSIGSKTVKTWDTGESVYTSIDIKALPGESGKVGLGDTIGWSSPSYIDMDVTDEWQTFVVEKTFIGDGKQVAPTLRNTAGTTLTSVLFKNIRVYESETTEYIDTTGVPIVGRIPAGGYAPLGTVVCVGDSMTAGYISSIEARFVGTTFIDAGNGGDTSALVLARFQTDVISESPDIVNLLCGVNDLLGGKTATEIMSNIQDCCELALASDASIVVAEVLPFGQHVSWTSDIQTQLDALNVLINSYASATDGVYVAGMYEVFKYEDTDNLNAVYASADYLHLNTNGSALEAKVFGDAMPYVINNNLGMNNYPLQYGPNISPTCQVQSIPCLEGDGVNHVDVGGAVVTELDTNGIDLEIEYTPTSLALANTDIRLFGGSNSNAFRTYGSVTAWSFSGGTFYIYQADLTVGQLHKFKFIANTSVVEIWLDGVKIYSDASPTLPASVDTFWFLKHYSNPLTSGKVSNAKLYNSSGTLIHFWSFEDHDPGSSETSVRDHVGGNDGTISGGTLWASRDEGVCHRLEGYTISGSSYLLTNPNTGLLQDGTAPDYPKNSWSTALNSGISWLPSVGPESADVLGVTEIDPATVEAFNSAGTYAVGSDGAALWSTDQSDNIIDIDKVVDVLGDELWDDDSTAVSNSTDNGDGSYTVTSAFGSVYVASVLTVGSRYVAVFTIAGYTSSNTGISGATTTDTGAYPNANGTHTISFIHNGSNPGRMQLTSSTAGVTFSNISVKQLIRD